VTVTVVPPRSRTTFSPPASQPIEVTNRVPSRTFVHCGPVPSAVAATDRRTIPSALPPRLNPLPTHIQTVATHCENSSRPHVDEAQIISFAPVNEIVLCRYPAAFLRVVGGPDGSNSTIHLAIVFVCHFFLHWYTAISESPSLVITCGYALHNRQ
jgi:hypothetical protein